MNFEPVKKYLFGLPVSIFIVFGYLVALSWWVGSWGVFLLVLPLYWHRFFKDDLMPEWW